MLLLRSNSISYCSSVPCYTCTCILWTFDPWLFIRSSSLIIITHHSLERASQVITILSKRVRCSLEWQRSYQYDDDMFITPMLPTVFVIPSASIEMIVAELNFPVMINWDRILHNLFTSARLAARWGSQSTFSIYMKKSMRWRLMTEMRHKYFRIWIQIKSKAVLTNGIWHNRFRANPSLFSINNHESSIHTWMFSFS